MQKSGKKKYLLLPALLCAVGSLAAFAACGDNHEHVVSDGWAFDETAHWHPTACGHDVKTDKTAHTFSSVVTPPTLTSAGYTTHTCACGYSYRDDEKSSLPDTKGDWLFDDTAHWRAVLAEGGTLNKTQHTFTEETVVATCSTVGYTKHLCGECGYWYADAVTSPLDHTYNSEIWRADEYGHWNPSTCCDSAKGAYTAHDFLEEATPPTCDDEGYTVFTCKTCRYTFTGRQVEAQHSFGATFEHDDVSHWRQATCAHTDVRGDEGMHVLVGNENRCRVCNAEVAPRLEFKLSEDNQSLTVVGAGTISGTEITVPDTYYNLPVKEIAAGAFQNKDVTSLTLGANVEAIGKNAFAGTLITQLTLPASVESVGGGAFRDGKALTSLTVNSIADIGDFAFAGCSALQTVTFTETGNAASIGDRAFEGCKALQTVTFNGEGKVKKIGARAFADCKKLTALPLEDCTQIGFGAFADCVLFAPAALSENLTVLGEFAFTGSKIETATLPASLVSFGARAFADCKSLTSVIANCTKIGDYAFENCTALITIALANTERVGAGAFSGCSALQAPTLPDSVVSFGADVFSGTQLITTKNNIKYAAGIVLDGKSASGAVTLENAVGIADGAFENRTALTSVAFGASVRFVGASAFRGCTQLQAIDFTGVVRIGANAFRKSGLKSVNIPASVQSVGDNAFYDCASLTSAEIHAKAIGNFAFSYTGAGRNLDNPVKERPSTAHLTTLTLGSEILSIGSNAFRYCPVNAVELPASLRSIGQYAFAQTNLTTVTIPESVTKIGEYAFYGCGLITARFEKKTGWTAGKSAVQESELTNANAAILLKSTEHYCDRNWTRSEEA